MLANNKLILLGCIIFILSDIAFSFYQHYHTALGGDLAQIVVINPEQGDYQVLEDPLGLTNETYSNPNRFFAHWFTSSYFKNIPLLLQEFVNPITSVYLATALLKMSIQLIMISLLTVFITGQFNLLKPINLLGAAIITPLFQTHGFNRYMGVIDQSIVYTLFYALPFCLILLFYLPIYLKINQKAKKITPFVFVILLLLIPLLTLSGPLLPGVIIIISSIYLGFLTVIILKESESNKLIVKKLWKENSSIIILFIVATVFSLYSLFVGQKNVLNPAEAIGLSERYSNIPRGLFNLITKKLGLPILLFTICLNYIFLIKNTLVDNRKPILTMFKWVFIFSLLYLILLPIGGYRIYRPNIIRYDTFLPITLALIFLFGSSTIQLLKFGTRRFNLFYRSFIFVVLLIFTNADRLRSNHFECEREALTYLKKANYEPFKLDVNCTVMEWQILEKPEKSSLNAGLFYYWNITKKKRLYYQSNH